MNGWVADPLLVSPSTGWLLVHHRSRFLVREQKVLLRHDELSFAPLAQVEVFRHGLGRLDGVPVTLLELAEKCELEGFVWCDLRSLLLGNASPHILKLLRYASQIGGWASQHRYCGSCGAPLYKLAGEWAMACAGCRTHHYPRISPCMIVLVVREDELLLARSPRHPPGLYSVLAGFVEPGESVEDCVHREVMEEAGVLVDRLSYCGSQSWPFPNSLMLAFTAQYVSGDIQPQEVEIEDARWFSLDKLPLLPGRHSIARYLIESYVAEWQGLPTPAFPL